MSKDKGLYGMISGVITTAILQPFENVKMALMIPPENLPLTRNFLLNMHLATRYIARVDGLPGFFKGVTAAAMKAGLGCFVYFAILR